MAKRTDLILASCCALAFGLAACGDDEEPTIDSGVDAGITDPDTGVNPDAMPMDATSEPDAGFQDAGPEDTGISGPRSIVFIHMNDEHSHHLGFAPNIDDYPTPATAGSGIVGGIYRRAAVINDLKDEARQSGWPTATVGAGDIMMGSLFHLANASVGTDYILAEVLGYDVLTLGNHEFDFGVDLLAGAIRQGSINPITQDLRLLTIPLVASNIRFSMSDDGDDNLEALYSVEGDATHPIRRTHMQTFGDVTVGFVGIVGLDAAFVAPFKAPINFSLAVDDQAACTSDDDCPDSICIPPAENPLADNGHCAIDPSGFDAAVNMPAMIADIASAVAELRQQGVDMVVAVSHTGINERELAFLEASGLDPADAVVSEEIVLAKGVDQALAGAGIPGLDLIVGGHSHTPISEPLVIPNTNSGINTYIVQAGSYGQWVGKIRLHQDSSLDPWELDTTFSGLVTVDDTVDTSNIGLVTRSLIDQFVGFIITTLEDTPLAQAGDGDITALGEQCDGAVLPNMGNCAGLVPGATGGTLTCLPNRQLDLSSCILPDPGNCDGGAIDGVEMCDGTNLPVADCAALGYESGAIECYGNCTLNLSACVPHFPTILEAALSFGADEPVRNNDTEPGDLFFYNLGTLPGDIGERNESNESNISNLVADAYRWSINQTVPEYADSPIQVAFQANGVIRDGLYEGQTGVVSLADLFRVVPLGVSPVETTPGYPLVDFYLTAPELKTALEIGVGLGINADSFWLGVSGARVEYDLALPAIDIDDPLNSGQITRVDLVETTTLTPGHVEAPLEATPLYDASLGTGLAGYPDRTRLVHVATSMYIALFTEGFGICPRTSDGTQRPECKDCTGDGDCPAPGSTCDTEAGVCSGGFPVAFNIRTTVPLPTPVLESADLRQELKEFLALMYYVRESSPVSMTYTSTVPRRMCCVETTTTAACPADGSRTCE